MTTILPQVLILFIYQCFSLRKGRVMAALVIEFPGKWASACHGAETNATNDTKQRPRLGRKRPRLLKARVQRITALLAELERISVPSAEVSAMLTRARASIGKVEERLGEFGSADAARLAAVEDEGDSQPHVDHDVLARHFHSIE
jgi:hypothetical protein